MKLFDRPESTADHPATDQPAGTGAEPVTEAGPNGTGTGPATDDRRIVEGVPAAGAGGQEPASAGGQEPAGAWRQVLMEFVDHPRDAVEKADRLVDEAVRSLTERINQEHAGLREAWHAHGEPSTEDLRRALRGYREFFEKVLSTR